ncbi:MAG: flagellar M-ring protein FliF [Oscillospiraceae bacterium]|nr:flagellar M-ring protein FliF [Oscillospiraceae bacterium]
MNTKPKELWEKVKDFFKNMSTKVRVILCVILVAVIALIAALYIRSTNQPYTTLFSGLSDTEKSSIVAYLEENALTDYRIEGSSILVRSEQEPALLARLLAAGYPKSGSIYEFYTTNVGTLTTNSERDTYWLIAREQKMEAVIRCFDGIKAAQVQIDLGKDQTYVLDDSSRTEPSVAIQVDMENGQTLDNQSAQAIRALAVGALAGLKEENVTITDTNYNTYGNDSISNFSDNSQLKLQLQEYYNNMIRTQVMQALDGIYGKKNVRVAVQSSVDVNRRMVESKEYTQPEGSFENGGLIGKESVLWVITPDGVQAVGGIPGTTTNADIPLYLEDAIQGAGDNAYAQYWAERDSKLNENSEQIEVASFSITDVFVAVTINENANAAANVNEEALREHVAMAAGIAGLENTTAARVSILMAPFIIDDVEPVPPTIFDEAIIPYIIVGAAILLVILILLITMLRFRRKRKKKEQEEMAAIEEQLGGEYGQMMGLEGGPALEPLMGPDGQPIPGQVETKADIENVNTEKSMELRKLVRQFAQSNPEIAAQVIKTWLKGGEDNGSK